MNLLSRRWLLGMLAALPGVGFAQSATDYPARQVRMIVPFGAGGSTDTVARLTAAGLAERLKQPVLVENRPGGATQIGIDAVAKAPADGYTLLVTANNVGTEQALNKEWPFRFERDLTMISLFVGSGLAVAVPSNIPVTNLRELVTYAKANPGKLNQAESGAINPEMAILKYRVGMPPIESVMYKGGALAVQGILSGEVHLLGTSVLDLLGHAKAGKLRIIAYTARTRHPQIPDVPTVNESGVGVSDFDEGFWFAMMGPGGLPLPITTKLNGAIRDLQKAPDYRDKIDALGLTLYPLSPAESSNRLGAYIKTLETVAASGVKLR